MRNIIKKFFPTLVLILALILLSEAFYLFLSFCINKDKMVNHTTHCSIPSPLTGTPLDSSKRNAVKVIYSPKDIYEPLYGINNADLVFECIDNKGLSEYNAIYYENIPEKPNPIKKIEITPLNKLPSFSFSYDMQGIETTKKSATYIFITLSEDIFSNFIYENGYYKHFKDTYMDIDSCGSQPVLVSNVIIQYTGNNEGIKNISNLGVGKGLLFSAGKIIDIEWSNDGNSPIKVEDENGNPILLHTGKTWWVIINENCPVAYN